MDYTNKKWLKRLAFSFGGLGATLAVAAIIIPIAVNVDDYRSKIVATANERLNGKLELGKLSLSLWGTIKVTVDGFTLTDSQNNKVVAAKDVAFHVPWLSILGGSPLLKFRMKNPEVYVVKDKKGKLNVLTLMKSTPASAQQPTAAPSDAKPGDSKPAEIPGIVANARLGVEMLGAKLSYVDTKGGVDAKVNDLNVVIKDLSLSRGTEMEIWATLDTKVGKTLLVKGPLRMTGSGQPKMANGTFESSSMTLTVNADDLELTMPGTFEKKKGVAANLSAKAQVTPAEARVEDLTIKFFNAAFSGAGQARFPAATGEEAPPVALRFAVKSNDIALGAWNALLPMLKEYELGGTAKLNAELAGTSESPQYRADFAAAGITAKAPKLKAQPAFDAFVKVSTDQIDYFSLTMKAPGNDLKIHGKLLGLTTKPRLEAFVASAGMDLDQLVDFPKPEKSKAGASGATPAKSAAVAKAEDDLDRTLDPLRENDIARATTGTTQVKMASLKAYNVKMTSIASQMSLRDLTFAVDSFGMGLWNGTVKGQASVNVEPKAPAYKFTADVASLDLKQAMTSQMDLLKNTLQGIASFKMTATGSSFNTEPAKKNLVATGNMIVKNATFATIDIGKIATDAINKSMVTLAAKVPQLAGKTVKPPANIDSKYESVTSNFSIKGGTFAAPDFFAKSEPMKGLDVKGATQVGMVDYSIAANWEIIDTHNLLKARDLSVDIAGTRVEHILAEGNGPVRFPIVVSGSVFAPQVNYTSVPEALAKVAMGNVGKAAEARAKAEVQKQIQAQTKKAAPQIQNAVQGLGKKLFGK